MNHYYEQFCQIAKDFGLDRFIRSDYYLCTLPGIHPNDYIMKYDEQKHKIYCANHLGLGGNYICCYGNEELRPKLARERIAKLVEQYKQLIVQKKLNEIKEYFYE